MDVFTREFGRFRLLAKGARRQKTGQRALLQPFQPLSISWSGKRSLGTLTGVEIRRNCPRLRALSLASAYYMSELLFKFLHAHDAHENLFDAYDETIQALCSGAEPDSLLRGFECSLLSEVGYGLQLERDAHSMQALDPAARYVYYPEKGPVRVHQPEEQPGFTVSGETLRALANQRFENRQVMQESKQLLRMLLSRQLPAEGFTTRRVYAQMLRAQRPGDDPE